MKNQAVTTQDFLNIAEDLRPLARDIARNLVPWSSVITKHGLSSEEFNTLLDSRVFIDVLNHERAIWESPESTPERIKLKGQHAVEEGMLDMAGLVSDPETNPTIRVKAFAELIRLAGTDNVAAGRASRDDRENKERFSISIHVGGESAPVCISGSMEEQEGEIFEAQAE